MFLLISAVLTVGLMIRECLNYGGMVPIRALNKQTRVLNLVLMFIQRFSMLYVVSYIVESVKVFDNVVTKAVFIPFFIYSLSALIGTALHLFFLIFDYLDKPKKPYK